MKKLALLTLLLLLSGLLFAGAGLHVGFAGKVAAAEETYAGADSLDGLAGASAFLSLDLSENFSLQASVSGGAQTDLYDFTRFASVPKGIFFGAGLGVKAGIGDFSVSVLPGARIVDFLSKDIALLELGGSVTLEYQVTDHMYIALPVFYYQCGSMTTKGVGLEARVEL